MAVGTGSMLSGQKVQNFFVQVAIYRCLLDIAAGMDYLHSLGVLHGKCHPQCYTSAACTSVKDLHVVGPNY
jgi:hypothetical protein